MGNRMLTGHAALIADLGLDHFHLLFGAGRVLLLGKMLLTEAMVTVWATSKSFFRTFMTTACGIDIFLTLFDFTGILHMFATSPFEYEKGASFYEDV